MQEFVMCSECFSDQGLKLDSIKLGEDNNSICPNCSSKKGKKLNKDMLQELAYRFFVKGTIIKTEYGVYPSVQFNEYQKTEIVVSEWLKKDMELIEKILKVGFFYYGPRLWMVGEVEPLKSLQNSLERKILLKE